MPVRTPPTLAHPTLQTTLTGVLGEGDVIQYLGIPYGTVSKRWTFASRRDDIGRRFDATLQGPKCCQEDRDLSGVYGPRLAERHQEQDEFTCLNLNVTRPLTGHGLPVLVWIHGGAFLMGSAAEPSFDPAKLVAWSVRRGKPLLVVAVNYRLGPFGFLYSSDLDEQAREIPWRGNFGLHDQRVALDWIQRHIRGFGGDPARVTIAGQSSGAYAIHAQIAANTHLASQPSLFARAIVQSGPLAPRHIWSLARLDRIWTLMLQGKEKASSSRERVKRLRDSSPEELLHLAHTVAKVGTWGVLADGLFISSKLFDSQWNFKNVEPRAEAIMVGDCADERSVFIARSRKRGVRPLYHALKTVLGPDDARAKLLAYSLAPESRHDEEVVHTLSHIAQDMRYLYPTDGLTHSWPKSIRYHVTLPNPFPESTDYGMAHHSIDTIYLFRNYNHFFVDRGLETHLAISDAIGEAWLAFVSGAEPWSGAESGNSANFAGLGMRIVPREEVRLNVEQQERLSMWSEVGLENVGRIANLWMSEQDSRGETEGFVY